MRAPLGTLVIRYRTRLAACQRPFVARCAMAVAATCAVPPMHAGAQRAEGAIAVSLIIAPTVELRTVAVTERVVDSDAITAISTTRPPTVRKVRFDAPLPRCSERSECERAERTAGAVDDVAVALWQRAAAHQLDVARLIQADATPRVLLRTELLVAAGT